MREAIGGSILFYIILGFIGVFIVFIAIIMNYAAAYRTNNYIVTTIEQYEGSYEFGNRDDLSDAGTLVGDLKKNGYYNGLDVTCSDNINGAVFKVVTYVNFYIPLIDVGFPLSIVNETKTIYNIHCSDDTIRSNGNWSGSN